MDQRLACEHEFVDVYAGWGYTDDLRSEMLVWVFCKKCLKKRKLYFDMREVYDDELEEEPVA